MTSLSLVKKVIIGMLMCCFMLVNNIVGANPLPDPDTWAESACLIDAEDNGVLYGKDEDKIMHSSEYYENNDSYCGIRKWKIR